MKIIYNLNTMKTTQSKLLAADVGKKDGDKSVYVYGQVVNGLTFIDEIKITTLPSYE